MSASVQSMFDAIAGRYDRLNRVLSAGRDKAWRRKAIGLLPAPGSRKRVLDLCGGTGDFCLALRSAGVASACVIGDFSRPMLARAAAKPGLSAQAVAMDALQPPFRAGVFDGVLCGFGMRNLDDLDRGIRAAHALLGSGGVFITLEFFKPETRFTRFFYRVLAPVFIPLGGWLLASRRDAYAYLVRSVLGFCGVAEYARLCRAAGFERVEASACDFGIAHVVVAVKGKVGP